MNKKNLSLDIDYRKKDYHFAMLVYENYEKKYPKEMSEGIKSFNASRAKFHYLTNEMNFARRYFVKSSINIKNIAYFITSYIGSEFIRRKFNVFG